MHGSNGCLAVGAGVLVEDAAEAHRQATSHGARSALEPTVLSDEASATHQTVSEVELYGDVVLRFVSGTFKVSLAAQMWLAQSQRFLSGLHHLITVH